MCCLVCGVLCCVMRVVRGGNLAVCWWCVVVINCYVVACIGVALCGVVCVLWFGGDGCLACC